MFKNRSIDENIFKLQECIDDCTTNEEINIQNESEPIETQIALLKEEIFDLRCNLKRCMCIIRDLQNIVEDYIHYNNEKVEDTANVLWKHTHDFHTMLIGDNKKKDRNIPML